LASILNQFFGVDSEGVHEIIGMSDCTNELSRPLFYHKVAL